MMLNNRPILDLRNKFTEIYKTVEEINESVSLSKNDHCALVVMNMEQSNESNNDEVETGLKEAELEREITDQRFTHEEIFSELRERIDPNNIFKRMRKKRHR
jgi:hypothetical protein